MTDAEKKTDENSVVEWPGPTKEEIAAVKTFFDKKERKAPAPGVLVTPRDDGSCEITVDHKDQATGYMLLMSALGTTSEAFTSGLLTQLASAGSQGQEMDASGLNFMLAVVKDIEPRDQVETMLAAQMAAVHMATMTFARRLATVDNIGQQDAAERAFNKLTRTYAAQVEALKRYRSKGEQKVIVEHVTVNEGGQAIVGSVTHRGRGGAKKQDTSP